jgi:predicted lipoprotein with Yx(FWY)xxD motif
VRHIKRLFLTGLALAGGAMTGCGEDSGSPEEEMAAAQPKPAADAAKPRGPLVKLRDSDYGRVLFSGRDRAIYLFTKDSRRRTRCYGDCAKAWPPFYAKGRPRAAPGVKRSLLGTIERRDGRRQVTYRGHPLYFYDEPPRQILCQNVVEFGGTWLVVNSSGNAVR